MLAWKIALRYLFSKKSHGVVNIISVISVIGVAVATMAIIIVLSIFNGFSDLAASHLSVLDPQIKVVPVSGKTVANGDSLAEALGTLPFVEMAMPAIEERGLVIFGNQQMPVHFKGVPSGYERFADIDSVMLDGNYVGDFDEFRFTQISSGIAMRTGARAGINTVMSLYVPRRIGRINPANPASSFNGGEFVVSGVFQIGQAEYDLDHMYVDLEQARDLLQYTTESTSVDLKLAEGTSEKEAVAQLAEVLGAEYKTLTRLQQQEEAFRMIQVEKWVTFLMLAFILVIASFNIISTLSLLVIEKRSNMSTLRALGAPHSLVRSVFIIQGWLISVAGGIIGILGGTALSLGQQWFGFVKLSGNPENLTINTYPVHVDPNDLIIVFALVVIVGFLTSQVTRLFTKNI